MAHNDFLPVEDNISSKKSVKKQIIWTAAITILLGVLALAAIEERTYHDVSNQSGFYEATTNSTIVMLITIGFTFFLILGMLLLKSIEWQYPEKREKTLHFFYLAILVLSIIGIFLGIIGLIA
ncbi:MAG: hypothetical protein LBJ63_06515 [Prevotellaceae bacterium]|jgi:hypothetical protein|nr:hypothetical protein [Prevotellaceae bacterium]